MVGAKLSKPSLAAVRRLYKEKRFTTFIEIHGINAKSARKMAKGKYVAKSLVRKMDEALKADAAGVAMVAVPEDLIRTIVCTEYGLFADQLRSDSGNRVYGEVKALICYHLLHDGRKNKSQIARLMGYASHGGVINALETIEGRIEAEEDLKKRVARIRTKLNAAIL